MVAQHNGCKNKLLTTPGACKMTTFDNQVTGVKKRSVLRVKGRHQ